MKQVESQLDVIGNHGQAKDLGRLFIRGARLLRNDGPGSDSDSGVGNPARVAGECAAARG